MTRIASQATALAVIAATCWSGPAAAYKISVLGRYHERMTVLSERCLPQDGSAPAKCAIPPDVKSFKATPWRSGDYWRAARWPDDPTRQASSLGVLKFLVNVGIDGCVRYIGAPRNDFAGLLCNSHYGTLQFMHAMGSIAPGETVTAASPESFSDTRDKMLGWTRLAFMVATGALPTTSDYCVGVRTFGKVGAALAPATFPYCGAWTVGTLFGFQCPNPLTSVRCPDDLPEAEMRRAALGSILHMIQDSYSRSHAGRGEELASGPYIPATVRCQPIKTFYRYSLSQKKSHGPADKAPGFAVACRDPSAMDPITAGARILWLAENACDASWAVDLVSTAVIANEVSTPPSNLAACRSPIATHAPDRP